MFPPLGTDPREWTAMEWCFTCDRETEHIGAFFVDEGVTEVTCTECSTVA